jgi:competence protein ComEC
VAVVFECYHSIVHPHYITVGIVAFALGILCASHELLSLTYCALAIATLSIAARYLKLTIICIIVACFLAGYLRFALASYVLDRAAFTNHEDVSVSGIIVKEPEHRDRDQRFVLAMPNGIRMLVYTSLYADLAYGDQVAVTGTFEYPEDFEAAGGRTFHYTKFLEKDGITGLVRRAEVTVMVRKQGSKVITALLAVKHYFVSQLHAVLPPDEAGLVSGFLIEGRQAVSGEMQDTFRRTGLSHTVALSGFNVSIILNQVVALCLLWSRRLAFVGGSASILLFVLMTGGQTTVIRASLMAFAALIGRCTNRRYDAGRGLLISALCMLAWNPYTLAFDFSFQLSFLATFALIHFSDFLYLFFTKTLPRFATIVVRESIVTTSAVYVFMTPFLLYTTGTFSAVALPANFLVVPTVPWAMLAGFVTGVFGMVSHSVSQLVAYLLHYLLMFDLSVISWFSQLSFAYYETLHIPGWACAASYSLFGFLLWWFHRQHPRVETTSAMPSQSFVQSPPS